MIHHYIVGWSCWRHGGRVWQDRQVAIKIWKAKAWMQMTIIIFKENSLWHVPIMDYNSWFKDQLPSSAWAFNTFFLILKFCSLQQRWRSDSLLGVCWLGSGEKSRSGGRYWWRGGIGLTFIVFLVFGIWHLYWLYSPTGLWKKTHQDGDIDEEKE